MKPLCRYLVMGRTCRTDAFIVRMRAILREACAEWLLRQETSTGLEMVGTRPSSLLQGVSAIRHGWYERLKNGVRSGTWAWAFSGTLGYVNEWKKRVVIIIIITIIIIIIIITTITTKQQQQQQSGLILIISKTIRHHHRHYHHHHHRYNFIIIIIIIIPASIALYPMENIRSSQR